MTLPSADALVAEGLAFEKAGKLADGIRCYLAAARVHPTAQAYWHLVQAQMQVKQFTEAHENCRAAVALFPQKAVFHQLLARLEDRLGNPDGVRDVLRAAAALFPGNADVVAAYATAQIRTKEFAEAIPTLEQAIALHPRLDLHKALVKMNRAVGDKDGALRAVRAALEHFPLDVSLVRLCAQFDEAAAARARGVLKAAVPALDDDPAVRSRILRYLTEVQAGENRKSAGLSRNQATGWADLVQWSDPEGMAAYVAALDSELAGPRPRAEALAERGAAAHAQRDWEGAARWFAQARRYPTGTVTDVTVFDPEFYRRLEGMTDEEIWAPFPPVTEVMTRETWPATLAYIACDPKYFELFAPKLLESLASRSPAVAGGDIGVHIHLLDGTEEEWRRVATGLKSQGRLSVSMTAESGARRTYGAAARNYYHAARYIRFHQYLVRHAWPVWILDADLVVEADPGPLFDALKDHDFVATTSAVSLEPWAKIQAGIVGIAPTPAGLAYLRLVAAFISHWFRAASLPWGIDQQALFGVYFYLEQQARPPKSRFLGEETINDRDGLPCIFRSVTDAGARLEKSR